MNSLDYLSLKVFLGIGMDFGLLYLLKRLDIDCIVAPLAIIVGATYATIHLIFSFFGLYVFMGLYPWVIGVTGLAAVMEGLWDGFNGGRRDFTTYDSTPIVIPWLSNNRLPGEKI